MRKFDWDKIEEKEGFDKPTPGGYVAKITFAEDNEEKEYIKIEWDFAEGKYYNDNYATFQRAGFWPMAIYRSYKESALGFFKAFKTALEKSNPGYVFQEENIKAMAGKYIGVVLGEEAYEKRDGTPSTRLYVALTKSVQAIREHDYEVPKFRQAKQKRTSKPVNQDTDWQSSEDELPF